MGIRYGGKILKFPYKVPSAKQNCRNINSSKLNAMLSLDEQCILIVRAHMLTSSTNWDMNTSPLLINICLRKHTVEIVIVHTNHIEGAWKHAKSHFKKDLGQS